MKLMSWLVGLGTVAGITYMVTKKPLVLKAGTRYHVVVSLETTGNRSVLIDELKNNVEAEGATGFKVNALGDLKSLIQYDYTAKRNAPFDNHPVTMTKDGNTATIRVVSLQELA